MSRAAAEPPPGPPPEDRLGESHRPPRPVSDEQVETYLADLSHDLRVERALIWKELVALLITALVAAGYVAWAV
jgi:hypothetical protein